MGILTDVTRLHRVEAKSEAIQNRLSFLIEASSAVMWTLNADGYPGDRRGWAKLTGQTLAETQNSGWLDAIHPDDRNRIKDIWNSAVESRTPYKAEYRLRTADGAYRWFRAHAVPVLNKDKSVREWLAACFDVHVEKTTSLVLGDNRITGAQIRAARGILNWSIRDIAEATTISGSSIRRLEETNGPSNDPEDILHILPSLRTAFEAAGVEFLFLFAGKPGVRPR
jgi:PAS domain S-box-containing protein